MSTLNRLLGFRGQLCSKKTASGPLGARSANTPGVHRFRRTNSRKAEAVTHNVESGQGISLDLWFLSSVRSGGTARRRVAPGTRNCEMMVRDGTITRRLHPKLRDVKEDSTDPDDFEYRPTQPNRIMMCHLMGWAGGRPRGPTGRLSQKLKRHIKRLVAWIGS